MLTIGQIHRPKSYLLCKPTNICVFKVPTLALKGDTSLDLFKVKAQTNLETKLPYILDLRNLIGSDG